MEFFLEAESPLAPTSVIGMEGPGGRHPPDPEDRGWLVGEGKERGGRTHYFTEVENFGAGRPRPPATEEASTRASLPRLIMPDLDPYTSGRKHQADRPRARQSPLPVLHPLLDARDDQGYDGRRGRRREEGAVGGN